MSVIDTLIFDRKLANVVPGDPKGKYDYVDYNRVGEAINFVANYIGLSGINAKINWTNTDIPRQSDITLYRQQVKEIVNTLGTGHPLPTSNNDVLTITGANQIERALYEVYNLARTIMSWQDVNNLQETWDVLDAKQLTWSEYFVKPS